MGRSAHFSEGASPHYRNTEPVPVEQYGMQHVRGEEVPTEYMAHHAILGPDADKHGTAWQGAPTETIPAGTVVKTTQEYVGRAHVEGYKRRLKPNISRPVDFGPSDDEGRGQAGGNPRLARINGELWGVDGHHRVAAVNDLNRPYRARVYDVDVARKQQFTAGPAPKTREAVVSHLSEGHVRDNDFVNSDQHDPDGEDSWTDGELHGYHAELHAGGVADHHHS